MRFKIYVIDAGRGDAFILSDEENDKIYFLDAGPRGYRHGFNWGAPYSASYLSAAKKAKGITDNNTQVTPEVIVLTHVHEDHYGGFLRLLTGDPSSAKFAQSFITQNLDEEETKRDSSEIIQLLSTQGFTKQASMGDIHGFTFSETTTRYAVPHLTLRLLVGAKDYSVEKSLVNLQSVLIFHQGTKSLFTGDSAGHEILKYLQSLKDNNIFDYQTATLSVFKVPHHGSVRNSQKDAEVKRLPLDAGYVYGLLLLLQKTSATTIFDPLTISFPNTNFPESIFWNLVEACWLKISDDERINITLDNLTALHNDIKNALCNAGANNSDIPSAIQTIITRSQLKIEAAWKALTTKIKQQRLSTLTSHTKYFLDNDMLRNEYESYHAFARTTRFYRCFKADNYIISADGTYGHPSPETIAGIAYAASINNRTVNLFVTHANSVKSARIAKLWPTWQKNLTIYYLNSSDNHFTLSINSTNGLVTRESIDKLKIRYTFDYIAASFFVLKEASPHSTACLGIQGNEVKFSNTEQAFEISRTADGQFKFLQGNTRRYFIATVSYSVEKIQLSVTSVNNIKNLGQIYEIRFALPKSQQVATPPALLKSQIYKRFDRIDPDVFNQPASTLGTQTIQAYFGGTSSPVSCNTILTAFLGEDNLSIMVARTEDSSALEAVLNWDVALDSTITYKNISTILADCSGNLKLILPAEPKLTVRETNYTIKSASIVFNMDAELNTKNFQLKLLTNNGRKFTITPEFAPAVIEDSLEAYLTSIALRDESFTFDLESIRLHDLLDCLLGQDTATALVYRFPDFFLDSNVNNPLTGGLSDWIVARGSATYVEFSQKLFEIMEVRNVRLDLKIPSVVQSFKEVLVTAGLQLDEAFSLSSAQLMISNIGGANFACTFSMKLTIAGIVINAVMDLMSEDRRLTFTLSSGMGLNDLMRLFPSTAPSLTILPTPTVPSLSLAGGNNSGIGFDITQPFIGANNYTLESVFLNINLERNTDLASVLPTIFSPTNMLATIRLFHPLEAQAQRMQLSVSFQFQMAINSQARAINAVYTAIPLATASSYAHSIKVVADPSTTACSLADLLNGLGLGAPLNLLTSVVPLVGDVATTLALKQLIIMVADRSIHEFNLVATTLTKIVLWQGETIDQSITIADADLELDYFQGSWHVSVETTIQFGQYPINASCQFPTTSVSGQIKLTNDNPDFTINVFLQTFSIDLSNVPIIGALLDLRLAEATIIIDANFALSFVSFTFTYQSIPGDALDSLGIKALDELTFTIIIDNTTQSRRFSVSSVWGENMVFELNYNSSSTEGAPTLVARASQLDPARGATVNSLLGRLLAIGWPGSADNIGVPLIGGLNLGEGEIAFSPDPKNNNQLSVNDCHLDFVTAELNIPDTALRINQLRLGYTRPGVYEVQGEVVLSAINLAVKAGLFYASDGYYAALSFLNEFSVLDLVPFIFATNNSWNSEWNPILLQQGQLRYVHPSSTDLDATMQVEGASYKKGVYFSALVLIFGQPFLVSGQISTNGLKLRVTHQGNIDFFSVIQFIHPRIGIDTTATPKLYSGESNIAFFGTEIGNVAISYQRDLYTLVATYLGQIANVSNPRLTMTYSDARGLQIKMPFAEEVQEIIALFDIVKRVATGPSTSCGALGNLLMKDSFRTEYDVSFTITSTTATQINIRLHLNLRAKLSNSALFNAPFDFDLSFSLPHSFAEFVQNLIPELTKQTVEISRQLVLGKDVASNVKYILLLASAMAVDKYKKEALGTLICEGVEDVAADAAETAAMSAAEVAAAATAEAAANAAAATAAVAAAAAFSAAVSKIVKNYARKVDDALNPNPLPHGDNGNPEDSENNGDNKNNEPSGNNNLDPTSNTYLSNALKALARATRKVTDLTSLAAAEEQVILALTIFTALKAYLDDHGRHLEKIKAKLSDDDDKMPIVREALSKIADARTQSDAEVKRAQTAFKQKLSLTTPPQCQFLPANSLNANKIVVDWSSALNSNLNDSTKLQSIIEIAADPDFTNVLLSQTVATTSFSFENSILRTTEVVYIRIKAIYHIAGDAPYDEQSENWSTSPAIYNRVAIPSPTSVSQQYADNVIAVTFATVVQANSYQVQIIDTSTSANTIVCEKVISREANTSTQTVNINMSEIISLLHSGSTLMSSVKAMCQRPQSGQADSEFTVATGSALEFVLPPTNIQYRFIGGSIQLTWDPEPGYDTYIIAITDQNGLSKNSRIYSIAYTNRSVNFSLLPGENNIDDTLTVKVYAIVTQPTIALSAPVTFTQMYLPSPQNIQTRFDRVNNLRLNWDPVPGATSYTLIFSTPPIKDLGKGAKAEETIVSVTTNSYTILKELKSGKFYEVQIKAVSAIAESAPSARQKIQIPVKAPLPWKVQPNDKIIANPQKLTTQSLMMARNVEELNTAFVSVLAIRDPGAISSANFTIEQCLILPDVLLPEPNSPQFATADLAGNGSLGFVAIAKNSSSLINVFFSTARQCYLSYVFSIGAGANMRLMKGQFFKNTTQQQVLVLADNQVAYLIAQNGDEQPPTVKQLNIPFNSADRVYIGNFTANNQQQIFVTGSSQVGLYQFSDSTGNFEPLWQAKGNIKDTNSDQNWSISAEDQCLTTKFIDNGLQQIFIWRVMFFGVISFSLSNQTIEVFVRPYYYILDSWNLAYQYLAFNGSFMGGSLQQLIVGNVTHSYSSLFEWDSEKQKLCERWAAFPALKGRSVRNSTDQYLVGDFLGNGSQQMLVRGYYNTIALQLWSNAAYECLIPHMSYGNVGSWPLDSAKDLCSVGDFLGKGFDQIAVYNAEKSCLGIWVVDPLKKSLTCIYQTVANSVLPLSLNSSTSTDNIGAPMSVQQSYDASAETLSVEFTPVLGATYHEVVIIDVANNNKIISQQSVLPGQQSSSQKVLFPLSQYAFFLTNNSSLQSQVRAVFQNIEGINTYSTVVSSVNSFTIKAAPVAVVFKMSKNTVDLTWDGYDSKDQYDILITDCNGNSFNSVVVISRLSNGINITGNNIADDNRLNIHIKAVTTASTQIPLRRTWQCYFKLLTMPGNVKIAMSSQGDFTVSWDPVAEAQTYVLSFTDPASQVLTYSVKTLNYTNINANSAFISGQSYTVQVKAISELSESPLTAAISFTLPVKSQQLNRSMAMFQLSAPVASSVSPGPEFVQAASALSQKTMGTAEVIYARLYNPSKPKTVSEATSIADPTHNRWGAKACSFGHEEIIIIGGFQEKIDAALKKDDQNVVIFDSLHKTYQILAPLPQPGARMGITCAKNKADQKLLFVCGGTFFGPVGALSALQCYDVTKKTWELKAPMPTNRFNLSLSNMDNFIYAIGGENLSGTTRCVEIYDMEENLWLKGKPLPTPKSQHASIVVDNKIYVMGGNDNLCYMFDVTKNQWLNIAAIPGMSFLPSAIYLEKNKIILLPAYPHSEALAYDIESNRWSVAFSMPHSNVGDRAIVYHGGKISCFGGRAVSVSHGRGSPSKKTVSYSSVMWPPSPLAKSSAGISRLGALSGSAKGDDTKNNTREPIVKKLFQ